MLLGKFSLLQMAKYWKHNTVIWTHCSFTLFDVYPSFDYLLFPAYLSLIFFLLFKQLLHIKYCSLQRDSNTDHWSGRQTRWPLEHHHPNGNLQSSCLYKWLAFHFLIFVALLTDLLSVFSSKRYKIYNKLMWINIHPVFGAGIRSHSLLNISLLP